LVITGLLVTACGVDHDSDRNFCTGEDLR